MFVRHTEMSVRSLELQVPARETIVDDPELLQGLAKITSLQPQLPAVLMSSVTDPVPSSVSSEDHPPALSIDPFVPIDTADEDSETYDSDLDDALFNDDLDTEDGY